MSAKFLQGGAESFLAYSLIDRLCTGGPLVTKSNKVLLEEERTEFASLV